MVAKEVKLFAQLARDGASIMLERAQIVIDKAGGTDADAPVELPETRFHLPLIYGLTGVAVRRLADLSSPLELAADLIGPAPVEEPRLPYLGTALDAGISVLISSEIVAALSAQAEEEYTGFPSDRWVAEKFSDLIGGGEVGFSIALGSPQKAFDEVLAEFAAKDVALLATGSSFAPFSSKERVIVFSDDIAGQAFSFGALARLALMNGVVPGDYHSLLDFCRQRLFGFVSLFADEDPVARAFAAAGISFGLATIVKEYTPQLLPIYSVPRF